MLVPGDTRSVYHVRLLNRLIVGRVLFPAAGLVMLLLLLLLLLLLITVLPILATAMRATATTIASSALNCPASSCQPPHPRAPRCS
jgi:hypothetical protein